MLELVCRLCLYDKKLIDIFGLRSILFNRLRKYVLLATGIQISQSDRVSKYICQRCVEITIMTYRYRQKALANDKALKEFAERNSKRMQNEVNERKIQEPNECRPSTSRSANIDPIFKIPYPIVKETIDPRLHPSTTKSPIPPNSNQVKQKLTQTSCERPNKRRKSNLPRNADNLDYSNNARKVLSDIFDSSRQSRDRDKFADNNTLAGSLLEMFGEEPIFPCRYCDRMFGAGRSLKMHQRAHKRCFICKSILRNGAALERHQREVCFKALAANPPRVVLKRCDDDDEIIRLYPAISRNQNVERERQGDNLLDDSVFESCKFTHGIEEIERIKKAFEKYGGGVERRNVRTLTKPQVNVCYDTRNDVILENLRPLLNLNQITVDFVANSSKFIRAAVLKKRPKVKDVDYNWKDESVVTLKEFS